MKRFLLSFEMTGRRGTKDRAHDLFGMMFGAPLRNRSTHRVSKHNDILRVFQFIDKRNDVVGAFVKFEQRLRSECLVDHRADPSQ